MNNKLVRILKLYRHWQIRIILICVVCMLHYTAMAKNISSFPNKGVNRDSLPKILKDTSLIVIDRQTRLCWMKFDFSYLKKRFLNNWNEIFEWQREIDSIAYAGYSDWRIPTIKEYRSINKNKTDREKYLLNFVQLDTACLWGLGPYSFWSATTPNKYLASYISFLDGFATSGTRDKQFSSPYSSWNGVELGMSVRLVRNMEME